MKKVLSKSKEALLGGYVATLNEGNFSNLVVPKPGETVDPKSLTISIINYVLFFLGVIAVVFIVYGGILYITSGGDSEKTTKARNTILYAVLGIIIIVLSFAIVNWAATLI